MKIGGGGGVNGIPREKSNLSTTTPTKSGNAPSENEGANSEHLEIIESTSKKEEEEERRREITTPPNTSFAREPSLKPESIFVPGNDLGVASAGNGATAEGKKKFDASSMTNMMLS